MNRWTVVWLLVLPLGLIACGDDEPSGTAVGGQCTADGDCSEGLSCLAFLGGYCGIKGCVGDNDCPSSSACVTHSNGSSYCFRTCTLKADCNIERDSTAQVKCSSEVTFVDGANGRRACVPSWE